MSEGNGDSSDALVRRHLRFGWWAILCFLVLGMALEGMHGFKLGFYLDVSNETRRLMWTLAHAHGVLLGLVNLGFAATVRLAPNPSPRWQHISSPCLRGANVLLPAGFFLGGIVVYGGDPNLAILLVPVGAALLLTGVLLTALDSSG